METNDEPGLEAAMAVWRERVRDVALGADARDELEDHVRTLATTLMSTGLDAQESVLIAARRTGSLPALADELTLAVGSPRNERLGWLLFGALAVVAAEALMQPLQFAMLKGLSPSMAVWAAFGPIAVAIAGVALLFRIAARRSSALTAVGRHRRWVVGGGLAAGLSTAWIRVGGSFDVDPSSLHWATWAQVAIVVLLPLGIAVGLVRLARPEKSLAPGPVS